jgi:hypothetical protein
LLCSLAPLVVTSLLQRGAVRVVDAG